MSLTDTSGYRDDVLNIPTLQSCVAQTITFLDSCSDKKEIKQFLQHILVLAYTEGALQNIKKMREFLL